MTDDVVNLEVNGVPRKAKKGQMIIHVTDAVGEYVPRFCYHEKLSIAANCRMCLVEVEKAPKPMPACATPVAEGMKVFTKSPRAIGAQKATMEFLLINHPLDCPICDQGGECELQDLAMGFGRDISRFNERKRVVKDKNIGPLVSTDMTRCIHCTRCVRFGQEIQGIQELGTTGRGEWMEIGTYVERSVEHELSGNIIDLCPVGALNSKPFRYQARSWEMTQHALVSPHDGVGTNLYGHVLRGRLMRVVPRANEEINETWIADRDRFSYEGVYAPDRLQSPMVRRDGEWQTVNWESALETAAKGLQDAVAKSGAASLGALGSPSSTVEELHLLARVARGLGSANLDHRLRQQDFRDQESDPVFHGLGLGIAQIERLNALLVVGSNLRREVPLIAHRVRKAALRNGARVTLLNMRRYEYLFPVANQITASADGLVDALAAIVAAAAEKAGKPVPSSVQERVSKARVEDSHRACAADLFAGQQRAIFLGALAMRHPAFADLRQLAAAIAELTGAKLGFIAEGANAAGAALAGVLPHRETGGKKLATPGMNVIEMLKVPLQAFILHGGIDPARDIESGAQASEALRGAGFVLALTPFADEATRACAHVMLPIGTFAETSGTFVNLEGRWQSFAGAASPVGGARPGWKVLRVLANLLGLTGFEHTASDQVRDELRAAVGAVDAQVAFASARALNGERPRGQLSEVSMYEVDALVRRAPALQRMRQLQNTRSETPA
jgi:NADH-quinone oxidoreductase subunit G